MLRYRLDGRTIMKTYLEIAQSYALWEEYIDPSGLTTEEEFNTQKVDEKIMFITECFGAEKTQTQKPKGNT